jgi:hypothetical protein
MDLDERLRRMETTLRMQQTVLAYVLSALPSGVTDRVLAGADAELALIAQAATDERETPLTVLEIRTAARQLREMVNKIRIMRSVTAAQSNDYKAMDTRAN